MKNVVLVPDTAVDGRIVDTLHTRFDIQWSLVNIELFYPPAILAQHPDLVIFDIASASGDWVWRLEQLKSLCDSWGVQSPVIIVLSASPSQELERLVRTARADFFLPKWGCDDSLDIALHQALARQSDPCHP